MRQRRAHTFIVRIHSVRGEALDVEEQWRGEVVYVPTERTAAFQGLAGVVEAVERLLAEVEGP